MQQKSGWWPKNGNIQLMLMQNSNINLTHKHSLTKRIWICNIASYFAGIRNGEYLHLILIKSLTVGCTANLADLKIYCNHAIYRVPYKMRHRLSHVNLNIMCNISVSSGSWCIVTAELKNPQNLETRLRIYNIRNAWLLYKHSWRINRSAIIVFAVYSI